MKQLVLIIVALTCLLSCSVFKSIANNPDLEQLVNDAIMYNVSRDYDKADSLFTRIYNHKEAALPFIFNLTKNEDFYIRAEAMNFLCEYLEWDYPEYILPVDEQYLTDLIAMYENGYFDMLHCICNVESKEAMEYVFNELVTLNPYHWGWCSWHFMHAYGEAGFELITEKMRHGKPSELIYLENIMGQLYDEKPTYYFNPLKEIVFDKRLAYPNRICALDAISLCSDYYDEEFLSSIDNLLT